MKDIFLLVGSLVFCAAVVWGLVSWSRRGQRKIAKTADEGWKEAGRKH